MGKIVGKTLFDYFNEKFENNLKPDETYQKTFERTMKEVGFDAYGNYQSFSVVRKRKSTSSRF